MRQVKTTLEDIYETTNLLSSSVRRALLINEMQLLEGKTINCFSCSGTCCTGQANSMQVTPIEALEILREIDFDSLHENKKENLRNKLIETVNNHRLNIEIYTSKKNSHTLRKSYTCPFFNNGSLGCGLSRAAKPYGCLGFNPKISEDNGQSCNSNIGLLKDRDNQFFVSEDLANQEIRNRFNLHWSKQNIPQALLDIIDRL